MLNPGLKFALISALSATALVLVGVSVLVGKASGGASAAFAIAALMLGVPGMVLSVMWRDW